VKVPRNLSVFVLYFFDEWVPPRIRDSKWFMYLPMKFVLRDSTSDFMTFKDTVFSMSSREFAGLYERTSDNVKELQGESDLNAACLAEIVTRINGKTVLEVGCGRGLLAKELAKSNDVVASDIVLPNDLKKTKSKHLRFVEANIEELPFKDNSFDYVVTTHTLEHVQNIHKSISELRRVASEGLIVVVPRQRPYKYGFSLHTQFFPYRWSLESAFTNPHAEILNLGDWFYFEKVSR